MKRSLIGGLTRKYRCHRPWFEFRLNSNKSRYKIRRLRGKDETQNFNFRDGLNVHNFTLSVAYLVHWHIKDIHGLSCTHVGYPIMVLAIQKLPIVTGLGLQYDVTTAETIRHCFCCSARGTRAGRHGGQRRRASHEEVTLNFGSSRLLCKHSSELRPIS